jgi:hypothetical protein
MNPQTQTQTDDEPNEFAALDTLDMLAVFVCEKYGEQALRETFPTTDLYREPLEKAADVLAAKGLAHVASIMLDIASGCPSEIESCGGYPPGSINARYWAANWLRKQWQSSPEFEKHLRAQKSKNTPKPSLRRH